MKIVCFKTFLSLLPVVFGLIYTQIFLGVQFLSFFFIPLYIVLILSMLIKEMIQLGYAKKQHNTGEISRLFRDTSTGSDTPTTQLTIVQRMK